MVLFWATLIINGEKTYQDTPRLLKEKVKNYLIEIGREDLIS